jgi:hypothetical protein
VLFLSAFAVAPLQLAHTSRLIALLNESTGPALWVVGSSDAGPSFLGTQLRKALKKETIVKLTNASKYILCTNTKIYQTDVFVTSK